MQFQVTKSRVLATFLNYITTSLSRTVSENNQYTPYRRLSPGRKTGSVDEKQLKTMEFLFFNLMGSFEATQLDRATTYSDDPSKASLRWNEIVEIASSQQGITKPQV
jgi:hypothetical protein